MLALGSFEPSPEALGRSTESEEVKGLLVTPNRDNAEVAEVETDEGLVF